MPTRFLALITVLLLAACGPDDPSVTDAGGCEGADCPDAGAGFDGGPGDAGGPDGGHDDGGGVPDDGGVPEDGGFPGDGGLPEDGGLPADGGEPGDGGSEDGGVSVDGGPADGGVNTRGLLTDYLGCEVNADCPVGYGECITWIPLNRPDSEGKTARSIANLTGGALTGICSRACTDNASVCDSLTIDDSRGDPIAYTCQLLVTGAAPVPAQPPLEPDPELTAGQPFGAICRPPFGLHPDVLDSLCKTCTASDGCGTGLCWSFPFHAENAGVTGGGVCLPECMLDEDCPFGFTCDYLEEAGDPPVNHGYYCVPAQRTCGICRDLDGDTRGTGRCGLGDLVTAFDCDDQNPLAYYDPVNLHHPFPDHCGAQDYDCNGVQDDTQQVGPEAYPESHCTACYETCGGDRTAGHMACSRDGDGWPQCALVCDAGYVDCNGDDADGCEVLASSGTVFWPDCDGDGFGDAGLEGAFDCDGSGLDGTCPNGEATPWVPNGDDCDDARPGVKPGGVERCNGRDDDCDGLIDAFDPDLAPVACGLSSGVCAGATKRCESGAWQPCDASDYGAAYVSAEENDAGLHCDSLDNDCDGQTDEAITGAACEATAALGACRAGLEVCTSSGLECQPSQPATAEASFRDGVDEDCDGFDGTASRAVWVSSHLGADTNPGTRQQPKRSLQAALLTAAFSGKPYVFAEYDSGHPFELTDGTCDPAERCSELIIPPGVALVGGFDMYSDGGNLVWTETPNRTVIRRVSDAAPPIRKIALTVPSGGGADTVLMRLQIETTDPIATTPAGMSSVGLRCSPSCDALVLRDVAIYSGQGAPGAAGADGAPGADGQQAALATNSSVIGTAGGASTCGTRGGKGGDVGPIDGLLWGEDGADGLPSPRGGAGGGHRDTGQPLGASAK